MKIRFSLVFILIAIFCGSLAAQSVVITGKKVTFTRKKPISDYKKTFTINYPKIKAATRSLSEKIESSISYEKAFDYFKLKEELDGDAVDSADYEVVYNKKGVLCISLFMETSAAYPVFDKKNVVVNLRTGMLVKPVDVFMNLSGLLKMVMVAKNREVGQAIKKDGGDEGFEEELKQSAKYNPMRLNQFSVSDIGITFYHDYQFPHVIQALQPAGEFKFTWKQLKPYIKPGGLLGQFVR